MPKPVNFGLAEAFKLRRQQFGYPEAGSRAAAGRKSHGPDGFGHSESSISKDLRDCK